MDCNVSWIDKYKDKQQSEVISTLITFVDCHPCMMTLKPSYSSPIPSSKSIKFCYYG